MTVDYTVPRSTHGLINEQNVRFTPASIPSPHYQLKNFLSTRCDDLLYYVSAFDIFAIHIPTNRRHLVKSLKWRPCCLDAAHGWIAAGNQRQNQCVFIQIVRDPADSSLPSYRHTEVDDLLSLDLNPDHRQYLGHSLSPSRFTFRVPRYVGHERKVGDEIVNSIVIHRLPGGREGLEDDTVAILTNNDKSVTIYSLTHQKELDSPWLYPCHMNHASISPDGNLLIAVGDEPRVFFHRRIFQSVVRKGITTWTWDWEEICAPRLRLVADEDCCFTTGFSPSGHVCAAATESGVVTLFNTALIDEDLNTNGAVIGIIRSSRTNVNTHRGAFRSMSFSPEPWNLLALGEEQGHVSIIDLRNALHSAQVLKLDTSSKDLDIIEVQHQDSLLDQRELDIERRFLESSEEAMAARNHLAGIMNATEYLDYTANPLPREREIPRTERMGDPHRLSESERSFLEAVSSRRPPAISNSGTVTPFSVNYTSGSNRWLPSMTPWDSADTSPATRHSLSEYLRYRSSERPRTSGERQYFPRRRSSVVVSQSTSNPANMTTSLAPITTRSSNLSASPSRLPNTSSNDNDDLPSTDEPWQRISEAMVSANDARDRLQALDNATQGIVSSTAQPRSSGRLTQGLSEQYRPVEDRAPGQIATLRELQARAERQALGLNAQGLRAYSSTAMRNAFVPVRTPRLDGEDEQEISPLYPGRVNSADGVLIMGVGWSADGRELFVATVDGIFRFRTHIAQRGQFPSYAWL